MERLEKTALFDHVRRVGSAHWHTHCFSSHFSATLPSIAMGARVSCQRRRCEAKVNATVVVNVFTLEVAVEDVNTDGEKKGLTTAQETLLAPGGLGPIVTAAPCSKGSSDQCRASSMVFGKDTMQSRHLAMTVN